MSADDKRAENAVAARDGRRGLHGAIDEIVESVLDAADEEILEGLGEEGGARALGAELLRELMLDVLGRYWARRRRAAVTTGAKEGA